MKPFVYNVSVREKFVYRIKVEETGEYCKNQNNEPCECGTLGWAEILMSNCKMQHPNKKLVLVKEKYNVKR
jgi:hypothetical protein